MSANFIREVGDCHIYNVLLHNQPLIVYCESYGPDFLKCQLFNQETEGNTIISYVSEIMVIANAYTQKIASQLLCFVFFLLE